MNFEIDLASRPRQSDSDEVKLNYFITKNRGKVYVKEFWIKIWFTINLDPKYISEIQEIQLYLSFLISSSPQLFDLYNKKFFNILKKSLTLCLGYANFYF